jgi:hypothetical protein
MTALNELEVAALAAIAEQYPTHKAELLLQFRAAKVINRQNTGSGFFTGVSVDRDRTAPVRLPSPIGDVHADIIGFQDQMSFLIFIADGYISLLEGFTIRDSTSGVDFGCIKFRMRPDQSAATLEN